MRRAAWPVLLIAVLVAAPACGSATVAGGAAPSSAAATASSGSAGSSARPLTARPGQPVPLSAVQRLTTLTDGAVKGNGDHPVQWATAVVTTRAKALTAATPGDVEPGGATVVYLVTVRGRFVCGSCSRPPGARAPSGTYLMLIIIAKTFRGSDFGLLRTAPPVSASSLGPVTYLAVHRG